MQRVSLATLIAVLTSACSTSPGFRNEGPPKVPASPEQEQIATEAVTLVIEEDLYPTLMGTRLHIAIPTTPLTRTIELTLNNERTGESGRTELRKCGDAYRVMSAFPETSVRLWEQTKECLCVRDPLDDDSQPWLLPNYFEGDPWIENVCGPSELYIGPTKEEKTQPKPRKAPSPRPWDEVGIA